MDGRGVTARTAALRRRRRELLYHERPRLANRRAGGWPGALWPEGRRWGPAQRREIPRRLWRKGAARPTIGPGGARRGPRGVPVGGRAALMRAEAPPSKEMGHEQLGRSRRQ